ncbi:hypothetical protein EYB34_15125 [Bordetella trematum]|uniref:hypothetical protein n=1 Tax=Bordetella trematum TaxID=123899 RepID=UPI0014044F29|nr:hypothetical protein [Bordetella trematum]QIM72576.1 hypothetical protein EYB34_15125 [Bordetella trematum]
MDFSAPLALARFLYGFSLAWAVAAILLSMSAGCLLMLRWIMRTHQEDYRQDLISGIVVLACVTLGLMACYAAGHALHAWFGAGRWAGGRQDWLAGQHHVSAAALVGATAAAGLMAAGPRLWRRWRARGEAAGSKPPKAAGKSVAPATKRTPKAAAGRAASQAAATHGPRRAGMGWAALFLLAAGLLLLALLHIVAPLLDIGAGGATPEVPDDVAERARPLYYLAAALLSAGALALAGWWRWRGPFEEQRRKVR